MPLKRISAQEAKTLMDDGGLLVDVREPNEHADERIPGARLNALSCLEACGDAAPGAVVIFHCKSGGRTTANADRLAAAAACEAYELEGGIEAWKAAGLPIARG